MEMDLRGEGFLAGMSLTPFLISDYKRIPGCFRKKRNYLRRAYSGADSEQRR